MAAHAKGQIVRPISLAIGKLNCDIRRRFAKLPEDARTNVAWALLIGFSLMAAACVASGMGVETLGAKTCAFIGFALFSALAAAVGEGVFTDRRDRLSIMPAGLAVLHQSRRYFAPWTVLGPFRVRDGRVTIEDLRVRNSVWRGLFTPLTLDPACHDLGDAAQMCAELNEARAAALRDGTSDGT